MRKKLKLMKALQAYEKIIKIFINPIIFLLTFNYFESRIKLLREKKY